MTQRGFAQALILIVIAVLGVIGYLVYGHNANLFNNPTPVSTQTPFSAIGQSKAVKVLVMKYFPLSSDNTSLDYSITGLGDTLTSIRAKVDNLTSQTKQKLVEGTRYHGYKKDSTALQYLDFQIVESREFLKSIPPSNYPPPNTLQPDYRKMLTEDVNICDYVDNQGVKQVWIWGYHTDKLSPVESNMAMGVNSKAFWNHGSYGDVSNSYRIDDLPVCQSTYTLFNYNYQRDAGMAIEDHNHHIEAIMDFVDSSLWNSFINPHGLQQPQINHCGWTHSPPNVTDSEQYNWISEKTVLSDCGDWKPEGGGIVEKVNCHTWSGKGQSCLNDEGVGFKVWWMQNIPGYNNSLIYQGKKLRNWWDFYADFDAALTYGKNLTL